MSHETPPQEDGDVDLPIPSDCDDNYILQDEEIIGSAKAFIEDALKNINKAAPYDPHHQERVMRCSWAMQSLLAAFGTLQLYGYRMNTRNTLHQRIRLAFDIIFKWR